MGRPPGSRNKAKEHSAHNLGENSRAVLKSLIDRIEAVEAEKQAAADDIKEIYAEAKSTGFDTAAMRAVIKFRKQDKAKRDERQSIIDAYLHALGELADTPLGRAAIDREFGEAAPV
jgi:uncharacterized protein (UPF0335 family)